MITRTVPWAVTLLMATAAWGQEPPETPPQTAEGQSVHPQARWAIDRIKSPYCPGLMLEVCSSSGGAMLRDSIQQMAERGVPGDSILEQVLAEYGEEWRAEPRFEGRGIWAWMMPPLALVIGLIAVAAVLGRRRRARATSNEGLPVSAEDEDRLREALHDLELAERPDY
jgi:cytochrome c-type biogenesis protein CcmH/NrfF